MKVYKVVCRNQHNQLVSWCWKYLRSEGTVVYKPDQWVSAKVGHLFAFRVFSDTLSLIAPRSHAGEVWLAEAVVSELPVPKYVLGVTALHGGKIKVFWNIVTKGRPLLRWFSACLIGAQDVPSGTVLCEKIKLIERMEVKDETQIQGYAQATKAA